MYRERNCLNVFNQNCSLTASIKCSETIFCVANFLEAQLSNEDNMRRISQDGDKVNGYSFVPAWLYCQRFP